MSESKRKTSRIEAAMAAVLFIVTMLTGGAASHAHADTTTSIEGKAQ